MTAAPESDRDLEPETGEISCIATLRDQPEEPAFSEVPPPDAKIVEQEAANRLLQLIKWIGSFAVPGIGMFMEAYFIFSVGNVKPIWAEQYPACWKVRFMPNSGGRLS